jgi:hypothetical protein
MGLTPLDPRPFDALAKKLESDKLGVRFMKRAGYDPNVWSTVFAGDLDHVLTCSVL